MPLLRSLRMLWKVFLVTCLSMVLPKFHGISSLTMSSLYCCFFGGILLNFKSIDILLGMVRFVDGDLCYVVFTFHIEGFSDTDTVCNLHSITSIFVNYYQCLRVGINIFCVCVWCSIDGIEHNGITMFHFLEHLKDKTYLKLW